MTTSIPRLNRGPSITRSHRRVAVLFVAPFFIVFLGIVVAPLVYAAWASTFRTRLIGGTQFVGLDNFVRVLSDPLFYEGLGRVLLYMTMQIPLTIGLALVVALALDTRRVRGGAAVRLLMFLPNAVPVVVAALMWGYFYGNDFGPIAQLFEALGLPSPDLLSSSRILGSMVNIAFWGALGYNMIIIYSALQTIPQELYEAATLDGAGQFRIAWSVKIPSVLPSIGLCILLSLIIGFQLFNEPNLLSPLAPGVIDSAYTPNVYIYNSAFTNNDLGFASAMSLVLGLLIILVSSLTRLRGRRKDLA